MMKAGMFFVMGSVALFLESGLIYCDYDYNNILDVPAEAISMAVCVSVCKLFLSKCQKSQNHMDEYENHTHE
jgi:hypothetical protein